MSRSRHGYATSAWSAVPVGGAVIALNLPALALEGAAVELPA